MDPRAPTEGAVDAETAAKRFRAFPDQSQAESWFALSGFGVPAPAVVTCVYANGVVTHIHLYLQRSSLTVAGGFAKECLHRGKKHDFDVGLQALSCARGRQAGIPSGLLIEGFDDLADRRRQIKIIQNRWRSLKKEAAQFLKCPQSAALQARQHILCLFRIGV